MVNWADLIRAAASARPLPVLAQTFYRRWKTSSGAVELGCADGNKYVVKGLRNDTQQGRMLFNDQAAARLGALIGAPVPQVGLVEVSAEIIAANANKMEQMGHMNACVAHGSLSIENVTERINNFDYADEGDNRTRFASLAIFFGWLSAGDKQFIFKKEAPRLVFSHDHGHFFPGKGPNWTIADLQKAPAAQAEPSLLAQLNLTPEELTQACVPLRDATVEQVAEALAMPPDDWGVGIDDRVAMAEFLHTRRAELLAAHAPKEEKGEQP